VTTEPSKRARHAGAARPLGGTSPLGLPQHFRSAVAVKPSTCTPQPPGGSCPTLELLKGDTYLGKNLSLACQGSPEPPPASPHAHQKRAVHSPGEHTRRAPPGNLDLVRGLAPQAKAVLEAVLLAVMREARCDDAQHPELMLIDVPGVESACD
jgi:hypothetical protein